MLFLGNALKTLDLALFKGLKIQCCELNEDYVKIMQQRLNKEFEVLK